MAHTRRFPPLDWQSADLVRITLLVSADETDLAGSTISRVGKFAGQ